MCYPTSFLKFLYQFIKEVSLILGVHILLSNSILLLNKLRVLFDIAFLKQCLATPTRLPQLICDYLRLYQTHMLLQCHFQK